MKRLPIQSLCFLAAVLCIAGLNAVAKDPVALRSALLLPAIQSATGSLTPPPKEWAMFPDESAPAAPPVAPPAGQVAAPGHAAAPAGSSGAAVTGGTSSNIVSASNARPVPHRELPLLWMLITGVLSLGAVVACGSLIVSKDAPEESEEVEEIPVVSEFQEITE